MARTNLGKIVMIPKGTYSTTVTYSKLDVVTSNGSGYISKSDNNLNKPLTNETYWMKLVEKGDKGDKGDSYIITEDDIQEIEDYVVDKTSGQIVSTRNELERVKNDILETGEDTDTFIHLEDSAWAEMQELEVEGVCEQETTQGYNILDENSWKNGYHTTGNSINTANNGCHVDFQKIGSTTQYFIRIEALQNCRIGGFFSAFTNESQDTSIGKVSEGIYDTVFSAGQVKYITVNVPAGAFYVGFSIYLIQKIVNGEYVDAIPIYENYKDYFKICISTTYQKDYEPYTGGQPSPSPDYPQNISVLTGNIKLTSCNKNLFDKDNITPDNFFNASNGYFYAMELGNEFKRKITASMSLKGTPSSQLVLALTDTYGSSPSSASRILNLSEPLMSKSFDFTNSEHVYLQIGSNVQGYAKKDGILYIANNYNIQIEEGSTATSYVDNLYSQITAKLPEGEFIGKFSDTNKDDVSLEYNKEEGQYHLVANKYIKKFILDGTENWYKANDTINSYTCNIKISHNADRKYTNSRHDFICNRFSYLGDAQNENLGNAMSFNTSELYVNAIYIQVDSSIASSVSELKTWLSTHPTEVYYLTDQPYKIDLGPIDMPLSYNEVTNIFTDSDLLPTINAKYYRNFITTIQNLQVNEKELKQELVDINTRLSALESANTNVATESEATE